MTKAQYDLKTLTVETFKTLQAVAPASVTDIIRSLPFPDGNDALAAAIDAGVPVVSRNGVSVANIDAAVAFFVQYKGGPKDVPDAGMIGRWADAVAAGVAPEDKLRELARLVTPASGELYYAQPSALQQLVAEVERHCPGFRNVPLFQKNKRSAARTVLGVFADSGHTWVHDEAWPALLSGMSGAAMANATTDLETYVRSSPILLDFQRKTILKHAANAALALAA